MWGPNCRTLVIEEAVMHKDGSITMRTRCPVCRTTLRVESAKEEEGS